MSPPRFWTVSPELVEQYENTIWQRMPGDDPVEPIVKRALEVAERVCRPILAREA